MNPEIKSYLQDQAALLPVNRSISSVESERRAGVFLEVCAKIIDWRHLLSEGKIESVTMNAVVYAEQLSLCTGRTITENKVTVEANPKYTSVREELESVENDVSYLKAMLDVFTAAHVFYRQQAKEQFGG